MKMAGGGFQVRCRSGRASTPARPLRGRDYEMNRLGRALIAKVVHAVVGEEVRPALVQPTDFRIRSFESRA